MRRAPMLLLGDRWLASSERVPGRAGAPAMESVDIGFLGPFLRE